MIPLRLIILTALFALGLSAATAYFQKDTIESHLLQQARLALAAADLPPVSMAFDGRAATLTGSVASVALSDEITAVLNKVAGIGRVSNQLNAEASGAADAALEPLVPEFNADGLYIPPRFHPLEKYSLSAVQFAYSSAKLTEASRPVLDKLAELLKQNTRIYIELSVHTDNQGTALGQMALSELRANAVRAYMVAQGIAAERIIANGYGASRPLAFNDTPQGRQQNRRVELAVLDR